MKKIVGVVLFTALLLSTASTLAVEEGNAPSPSVTRGIPQPHASHPGNIFLQGETVSIAVPIDAQDDAKHWRVLDDTLTEIERGTVEGPTAVPIGVLPIGWYRVEFLDSHGETCGFTTAAVLARLAEPVPQDSPIAVDVALSWLAGDSRSERETLTRLAALAGVNWVRDRIHWRELEVKPGEYAAPTKYDESADIQSGDGLKVLQVFHTTPKWALDPASDPDRPSTDLRHLYRFCKNMATRFQGRVQAWEPWNEGNAANFGGLTMDEMCSLQKAAYLGFKAGDPALTVGWNPIGGPNTANQAAGILNNETWPYFDVYSMHSYAWAHAYERLWKHARKAAHGRPIWITESDRGMKAAADSPWGDYEHGYALRKAEFVTQSYASSLYAGATRHFHFILGHYMEQHASIQFGLLRKDNTPRPSYVALAALGRLLAGGQCLGRWDIKDQPDAHVYAFRARPDGQERDVLVAWTEKEADWPARGNKTLDWTLPPNLAIDTTFDYLGRSLGKDAPAQLKSVPVFIVMAKGEAEKLPLRVIELPEFSKTTPSPVVLQLDTPGTPPIIRQRAWTQEPERVFEGNTDIVLSIYNFGDKPVSGTLAVESSTKDWHLALDDGEVRLDPMERKVINLRLSVPAEKSAADAWITIRGAFGDAGQPVLAFWADHPEAGER